MEQDETGAGHAADPFTFEAVPWLPPFRLDGRALLDAHIEVTHEATALLPFATLAVDAEAARLVPLAAEAAAALAETHDPPALRALLDGIPADDTTRAARTRRWAVATALAAAAATHSLRQLGDITAWVDAAAARRRWFLQALDRGAPPPAREVAAACHQVPHCLRNLGNALPTAEALALLRPLGRICELGAGIGLFARALERAGMLVAASDRATDADTGLAFPVRKGMDAAETRATFAARGALPPLLLLWPQPEEGAWFLPVVADASPGDLLAIASPELDFCRAGGLAAATELNAELGLPPPGAGWQAMAEIAARLSRDFEQLGEAPVVAAGWPMAPTPLRLWRAR